METILNLNFNLKRNDAGEIIGAGLSGDGSTESNIYCTSFVRALMQGQADIRFHGNRIIFEHKGCDYAGESIFERPTEEIEILKRILSSSNKNLKAEASSAWCGSFNLYLKQ